MYRLGLPCEASLMLIAIQLQELGGTIESVEVTNCHGMTQHYLMEVQLSTSYR